MGWSDMEARCKKHPSHRQSKGVCPSCLRERLAHLSATSSSTTTTASTNNGSSSSRGTSVYLSDSNNTSPGGAASPPGRGPKITRVKMAALLRARPEEPLTKSRSLAFVITETDGGDTNNKKAGKEQGRGGGFSSSTSSNSSSTVSFAKTKGFWARLMPGKSTRRRLDDGGVATAATKDIGALHSKTVKETASARWVL